MTVRDLPGSHLCSPDPRRPFATTDPMRLEVAEVLRGAVAELGPAARLAELDVERLLERLLVAVRHELDESRRCQDELPCLVCPFLAEDEDG